MPPTSNTFMKHWFSADVVPIIALLAGAVGGASYMGYRAAHGPDVVWTKTNAEPWNSIKPDEGWKLMQVNQKFDNKWHREGL